MGKKKIKDQKLLGKNGGKKISKKKKEWARTGRIQNLRKGNGLQGTLGKNVKAKEGPILQKKKDRAPGGNCAKKGRNIGGHKIRWEKLKKVGPKNRGCSHKQAEGETREKKKREFLKFGCGDP